MTILKRTGLVLLALTTLLALWIGVNSIDDAELSPLAKEMLKPFPEVPPEENGYNDVAYLYTNDLQKQIGLDPQLIYEIYSGKIKDDKKIETLLETCECKKLFDDLRIASSKPHFMFPGANTYLDALPAYSDFMRVWEFLILKARYHEQHGQIDEAIDLLALAIISSEKIRNEGQHFLISYYVGLTGHTKVVNEIHHLVTDYKLSKHKYLELIKILDLNTPFPDDGLSLSFIYEFHNNAMYLSEMNASNYKSRNKFAESLSAQTKSYRAYTITSPSDEIIDAYFHLNAMLPKYYAPENKTLNHLAGDFMNASKITYGTCKSGFDSLAINHDPDYLQHPSLAIMFKPNPTEDYMRSQIKNIGDYASRRCLYHTYINAMKTVIALQWYQSEHGSLPDSLTELVPGYISSVPIDAFDGQPIRYSKEKRWVYSAGNDYSDDGGSIEGFYRGGCTKPFGKNTDKEKGACRMNPTVPIDWNDYPAEMK